MLDILIVDSPADKNLVLKVDNQIDSRKLSLKNFWNYML